MARKKAQHHVIPRVYLKAFTDTTAPPGQPLGVPYTHALWLIPKSLKAPPRRRAPAKAFRVLNAYALNADAPGEPRLENWLSVVENAYARVAKRLTARAPLKAAELDTLSVFIATLYLRTPEQMAHWQRQIDALEKMYRDVDRGANGDERHSDEYFSGSGEIGKKRVGMSARDMAAILLREARWRLVLCPDGYGDVHRSLITSDTPVTRADVHVDDLLAMGFPGTWLDPAALPNRRAALFCCPLAPDLAFISSPLLRPGTATVGATLATAAARGTERGLHSRKPINPFYSVAPWPELFTNLNILTRRGAHELLVASRPDPFGDVTALVLAGDASVRFEDSDPRALLTIYTDSTRLSVRVTHVDDGEGSHALNSRLSFRTEDMDAVRILAGAAEIPEAEYRAPDGRGGGMRDARVIAVALTPEGETIIESGPEG